MEDTRPKRLQDVVQAGLILVLIILLLVVGSMSVGFMVKADRSTDRYETIKDDYNRLLQTMDTDLRVRIDRVREVSESDSYTKDRRLRLLEERTDALERELVIQRREIDRLKK